MYEHHKKSPWFAEKYDPSPEFANLRSRVRKEGWKGRLEQFLFELEEGKYDPVVADSTQTAPPSEEGQKDINTALPENGKTELTSPTDEAKPANDEDAPFAMDAEEEAPETDAKDESNGKPQFETKRALRSDELSIMPEGNEVMIRTIPPDIGRVKLEEVGSLEHIQDCILNVISGLFYSTRFPLSSPWRTLAEKKFLPCRLDQISG